MTSTNSTLQVLYDIDNMIKKVASEIACTGSAQYYQELQASLNTTNSTTWFKFGSKIIWFYYSWY